MLPTGPWISCSNADSTHILGCIRCDVHYCFGRGARSLDDDDLVLISALYVTNVQLTENGLCWCRCGTLVGVRTSTHVVLMRYKTNWLQTDSVQDSNAVSEWINRVTDARGDFWACVYCQRYIGYGNDFKNRLVDSLYMVNAVHSVDDPLIVRCLCGHYLGYHRGKDVLMGEIVKVVVPTSSRS